jgi:hypothetical protein
VSPDLTSATATEAVVEVVSRGTGGKEEAKGSGVTLRMQSLEQDGTRTWDWHEAYRSASGSSLFAAAEKTAAEKRGKTETSDARGEGGMRPATTLADGDTNLMARKSACSKMRGCAAVQHLDDAAVSAAAATGSGAAASEGTMPVAFTL